MSELNDAAMRRLPQTFRYSDARELMNERRFRTLLATGLILQLNRGLYRKAEAEGDLDLIEIAGRRPLATLCLTSALARHDLTDAIPGAYDIAIPRGMRPAETQTPVDWHTFDKRTFDIGRQTLQLDKETTIGLYNAERSIIDAFRMRETEGYEAGNEALRRWLRRRGSQPGHLIAMAADFPKAHAAIRRSLEILL
ncbi:hypothetical protein ISU10_03580 [Nocardioides agariphilus]|jgi:hypothetical protein|uniref:Transcriptional regulator, AbiEi antitoxin, Type IV TA system n=1 Tax=Nocardioides agariphilus TaxID=433664 RepID=A0A930VHR1_9ACTN|nr:hypothetical protein [Nocardioides agariphilus]MBF4766847.1 hypothetical protein [Nocardioides agariphilus]